jgi:hypothetical protein
VTRPSTCAREVEVLDLIAIGQWPARASADLATHVTSCECCADLAVVAMAVTGVREATHANVRVPDASLVWYRAQVRARQDAARRAARPMFLVQVAGVVVILAAVTIWSGGLTQWLAGGLARGWATITSVLAEPPSLTASADTAQQFWSPSSGVLRWVVMAMGIGTLAAVSLALGLSRLADGEELND